MSRSRYSLLLCGALCGVACVIAAVVLLLRYIEEIGPSSSGVQLDAGALLLVIGVTFVWMFGRPLGTPQANDRADERDKELREASRMRLLEAAALEQENEESKEHAAETGSRQVALQKWSL